LTDVLVSVEKCLGLCIFRHGRWVSCRSEVKKKVQIIAVVFYQMEKKKKIAFAVLH
jgi:hypothetical protein